MAHSNSSVRFSPDQEELVHEQHPGSAPYSTSHVPNPSLTAGGPDFVSRGILTFGYPTRYSPQPNQSFVGTSHPGDPVVGHTFLVYSQDVPAQSTLSSTGSRAPSGASIPPGNLRALPLHLAWSPAPPSFPPYDPQLPMSFVPYGRVDIQVPHPISVPSINPTGHAQPSHTTLVLRQNSASAAPPNAHPFSSKPFACPARDCGVRSGRLQERNRHIPSHLPYWIGCSFGACTWRGYRDDTFRKHLCNEHQTTGLGEHGYQIYDPRPLVDGIIMNTISIEDAKQLAIAEVERMAAVLGRQEWLEEPWGRKGRSAPSDSEAGVHTM
ncbi:hypothetical protein BJY52DRAFT_946463 [Lactarius psammicola]|nr:hypothetical protein BJY52DRAFT_946463 [Lactarius psammicola]